MSHASPAGRGAFIRADGWGWRHAGRKAWAVSGIELSIEPGERVLLLGASGAGKSTLLHAIAGVLGGDDEGEEHGRLQIGGQRPAEARGRAGLVLQDPDSQVIMARVGDDVAFGPENLGVPRERIWPRVHEALRAVGLDLPLDHPSAALSGGQKQRLALAGAIAMRPDVLLLDEPTANLDPSGVREVREAVASVLDESGATLIVVEHRVEVWIDLVTRVIVLDPAGGVLADGSPGEVLGRTGTALAEAGVWVPGQAPAVTSRVSATTTDPELSAHGLAIGRKPATTLRTGIDIVLERGRSTVVTGPNGAGKSTLALTLAGLLPAHAGAVTASAGLRNGLGVNPMRWKSRHLLSRIGTVFQEPEHQFVTSTVRGELTIGPRALGTPASVSAPRVDELLTRLRLDHLAEANPFTLSGGEKRRLTVGCVLATQPRLLVLDEPTFGQDRRTWVELVRLLGELLDEGRTLLSVSHDDAFLEALGERHFSLERVPASASARGQAS